MCRIAVGLPIAVKALGTAMAYNFPGPTLLDRGLGPNSLGMDTAEATRLALQRPLLVDVQIALRDQRYEEAQRAISKYIERNGRDAAALMMLAAIPARRGRPAEAAQLLREVVSRVPDLHEAQLALASVLFNQSLVAEAISVLDDVLKRDPFNAEAAQQRMRALAATSDYSRARTACEALLRQRAGDPHLWLYYGHLLKASVPGKAVTAYRRALALAPGWGEAWWSVANLKTAPLSSADIATMQNALRHSGGAVENCIPLHFALAKAFEDAGQYEEAVRHYAQGNRLRRDSFESRPTVEPEVTGVVALTTRDYFAARQNRGCDADDPIFIIGMPRSGTTLVEQILASHSSIEGTTELPHLSNIVQELMFEHDLSGPQAYPELLARLDPSRFAAIGEQYLQLSRPYRHSSRPYFIDKMPSNWRYIALIRLILPRARIVDVRRQAMDCCFANYRQLFGGGHEFAYALDDLGNHYRNYEQAVDHAATVIDDRLIRMSYDALVDEPEGTIRALLAALNLPFDPSCLRFHENGRAVTTPSAEQVRRPMNADGVGRWRHYERWLGPLIAALGKSAEQELGEEPANSNAAGFARRAG